MQKRNYDAKNHLDRTALKKATEWKRQAVLFHAMAPPLRGHWGHKGMQMEVIPALGPRVST